MGGQRMLGNNIGKMEHLCQICEEYKKSMESKGMARAQLLATYAKIGLQCPVEELKEVSPESMATSYLKRATGYLKED